MTEIFNFSIPRIGRFHLFLTGQWCWQIEFGRCDYGTLVILVPGLWFSYSDSGLHASNFGRGD